MSDTTSSPMIDANIQSQEPSATKGGKKRKATGPITSAVAEDHAKRVVADVIQVLNDPATINFIVKKALAKITEDLTYTNSMANKKVVKDPDMPKQPKTDYHLFCAAIREEVIQEIGTNSTTEISKATGARWKALTVEQKEPYRNAYLEAKAEYDVKKQEYEAKKGGGEVKEPSKKRVRKPKAAKVEEDDVKVAPAEVVDQEEEKVAAAAAVVRGNKGQPAKGRAKTAPKPSAASKQAKKDAEKQAVEAAKQAVTAATIVKSGPKSAATNVATNVAPAADEPDSDDGEAEYPVAAPAAVVKAAPAAVKRPAGLAAKRPAASKRPPAAAVVQQDDDDDMGQNGSDDE